MISLIYCYVFPFKMTQLTISSGRIIVRDLQYLRITQPGNVMCELTPSRGLESAGRPPLLPVTRPRVKQVTRGQDQQVKLIAGWKTPCKVRTTMQPHVLLSNVQNLMWALCGDLGVWLPNCCLSGAGPKPEVFFPAHSHSPLPDLKHSLQPFLRDLVQPCYDGAQGAGSSVASSAPAMQ